MIDSQDISEQELETLRGDAVGNNLYSESWIISTMMSLCEVRTNCCPKDLEEKLCTLWDLSMEDEVALCLLSYDFPKIAKSILEAFDNPRLIEIIIGIIGNACCNEKVIDTICCDKNLVMQILSRLTSDDTPTLIQLLRLLELITCKIRSNSQSDWTNHIMECEFFGESITFMLNNSTNDDLLIATMTVIESLSKINLPQQNFLERLFQMDNLITALLESFMQLLSTEKISYSMTELTFIKRWLEVFGLIMELGSFKINDHYETDENYLKLMEIIYRILEPWKKSYNLLPMKQLNFDVIHGCVRILLCLHHYDVNIPPRIDHILMSITFYLKTVLDSDSEGEGLDSKELLITFIDLLNRYWLKVVDLCSSEEIKEILRLCKQETREYLVSQVQFDSKTSPDKLEKLKNADFEER